jgi:hypothetical protein
LKAPLEEEEEEEAQQVMKQAQLLKGEVPKVSGPSLLQLSSLGGGNLRDLLWGMDYLITSIHHPLIVMALSQEVVEVGSPTPKNNSYSKQQQQQQTTTTPKSKDGAAIEVGDTWFFYHKSSVISEAIEPPPIPTSWFA